MILSPARALHGGGGRNTERVSLAQAARAYPLRGRERAKRGSGHVAPLGDGGGETRTQHAAQGRESTHERARADATRTRGDSRWSRVSKWRHTSCG